MDVILGACIVALLGAILGSYACATVWRLRASQLEEDKRNKDPYDAKEYASLKGLMGQKVRKDRSRCLHCGHTLAWYDLVPVVSWLMLRGKCRYCKKPIGVTELWAEVGLSAVLTVAYVCWPLPQESLYDVMLFVVWVAAATVLTISLIYDAKWFLLPDKITLIAVLLGVANVTVLLLATPSEYVGILLSTGGAIVAIAGLYGALHALSGGRWVGLGDVKLGVALGLLLADWQLAFLTVFAANVFGCILVLPKLIKGDAGRGTQVPFGPLLIAGWVFASLFGKAVIAWYVAIVLGV